eukprot:GDKJ01003341.1.p1 GENE.GDKJ01003341.1~~GDKJ01003341.1.p1  ORF type:complete len:187 (+),score=5.18 GDKJ01003341.1:33-593(+)
MDISTSAYSLWYLTSKSLLESSVSELEEINNAYFEQLKKFNAANTNPVTPPQSNPRRLQFFLFFLIKRLLFPFFTISLPIAATIFLYLINNILLSFAAGLLSLVAIDAFLLPRPAVKGYISYYIFRFHDREFQRQRREQARANGVPLPDLPEQRPARPWVARFVYQLIFGFFLSIVPFWMPADFMD